MGDNRQIAAHLATHDGIVTAAQARACGLSRHEIGGRVRRGEWIALTRGVYRSAAHDFTERALVRAVMAAHSGTADRTTAAWWLGLLDDLPSPLTYSTRSAVGPLPFAADVRPTRRLYLPDSVMTHEGLDVTRPALTALMTAAELPDGSAFLDRVLQVGAVNVKELTRAAERHSGLHGIVAARRLLAVASSDSESAAERLFVEILRKWQITGWVQQFKLGGFRFDFAWPALEVVVEIDGWMWHRTERRRSNDIRKSNMLQALKWRELHYNWHMLDGSAAACAEEVIAMVNSVIASA